MTFRHPHPPVAGAPRPSHQHGCKATPSLSFPQCDSAPSPPTRPRGTPQGTVHIQGQGHHLQQQSRATKKQGHSWNFITKSACSPRSSFSLGLCKWSWRYTLQAAKEQCRRHLARMLQQLPLIPNVAAIWSPSLPDLQTRHTIP